jgi:hypothetical protein
MTYNSSYRLRARNSKGDALHIWPDIEASQLIENLTVKEAYAIMEAHRSGYRFDGETRKPIRNRIADFELIHPMGHKEIVTRGDLAVPKTSVPDARVAAATACGECGIRPHDPDCGTGIAQEQESTGIHAACGIRVADHCAFCDTCPRGAEGCGCPAEDRVLPVHGDCGKPMADHCAACDECPRTDGPCWCVATVADDEPVITVPAGQGPRYAIDFGPLTVADVVTFPPVADILATLATVPDALPEYRVTGHGDRAYHLIGVDGDVATVRPVNGGMEWAHDTREVYREGSAVSIAEPRWTARHGKVKSNRRNRKG